MTSSGRTILGVAFAHWLTTVGVVVTTTSAFVFLSLAFLQFDNPYYGLVVFVLIPALFILGLLLIPLGLWLVLKLIPTEVLAEARVRAEEIMAQGKPTNWVAAGVIVALWLLAGGLTVWWLRGVLYG